MPKVTSLGHIGVYVRDIERSVAFYRDIFGLQVSDRSPRGAVFMTAQDRLTGTSRAIAVAWPQRRRQRQRAAANFLSLRQP